MEMVLVITQTPMMMGMVMVIVMRSQQEQTLWIQIVNQKIPMEISFLILPILMMTMMEHQMARMPSR